MNFLFGLLVGTSLAGSPSERPAVPGLSAIPLRCFAALDISDAEYVACRRPSMRAELYVQAQQLCRFNRAGLQPAYEAIDPADCDVGRHIAWEIAALRALPAAQLAPTRQ